MLRDQPDAEVIACLMACRGLGQWTGRVVSRSHPGTAACSRRRSGSAAVGAAYCHGNLPSETAVRELTAHWVLQPSLNSFSYGLSQGFWKQPYWSSGNDWRLTHLQDTVIPGVPAGYRASAYRLSRETLPGSAYHGSLVVSALRRAIASATSTRLSSSRQRTTSLGAHHDRRVGTVCQRVDALRGLYAMWRYAARSRRCPTFAAASAAHRFILWSGAS